LFHHTYIWKITSGSEIYILGASLHWERIELDTRHSKCFSFPLGGSDGNSNRQRVGGCFGDNTETVSNGRIASLPSELI
jgi:hypothetical protein